MCKHKRALIGHFDKSCYSVKHYLQENVTRSNKIGSYVNMKCFSSTVDKNGDISVDEIGTLEEEPEENNTGSIELEEQNPSQHFTSNIGMHNELTSPFSPYCDQEDDIPSLPESHLNHKQIMEVATRLSNASKKIKNLVLMD